MGARSRSWWQQIKKHRIAIGVVAMVLVVAITLIIVGYWFDWAGFNGYNKITVAHTISGTNTGTVIRTEEYQPGRTLWDWLQLLIIPAVLAVGGYLFNFTTSRNERQANEQRLQIEREAAAKRDQTERDIALDNQREEALQSFIDKMSELLLEKQLRGSKGEDEARTIARVRSLAVLPRLDGNRKRAVLQFLQESGLIDKNKRIIELNGANLTGTELTGSDLKGADLSETDLSGIQQNGELSLNALNTANLSSAKLNGARLHKAHMMEVKLRFAYLEEANLSEANLILADLLGANLSRANLSRANLSEAKLLGANLVEADLFEARLWKARLNSADLSSADLRWANLNGANLSNAKLLGADLSNSNLFGAIVATEQLDKAKSLEGATMPDGSIHP